MVKSEGFLMSRQRRKKSKKFFSEEKNEFKPKLIIPLNEKQSQYLNLLQTRDQIISIGSAGTGKTFLASAFAAKQLRDKHIEKIILARPAVGASTSVGFLKGTVEEKLYPWLQPMLSVMKSQLGNLSAYQNSGKVQMLPLEMIRGRSFENTIVLIDEAQNADIHLLKAIVTRQGSGSKIIIMGDQTQSDVVNGSGLKKLVHIGKKHGVCVGVVEFCSDDIIRSGIVKQWVQAFEKEEKAPT